MIDKLRELYRLGCFVVAVFNFYFREREREHVSGAEGQREKERESQAGSTLSMEPDAGLDPTTLGS